MLTHVLHEIQPRLTTEFNTLTFNLQVPQILGYHLTVVTSK